MNSPTKLCSVTSQNSAFFMIIAVMTSNMTGGSFNYGVHVK